MRILFRYLALYLLLSIGLALLALTLLFTFIDLIGELNDVRPQGYTTGIAMLFVLLRTPSRMFELMPIAVLVGALLAFSRLAANSEFTVMRASGLSPQRTLAYLSALGLLLGLANLGLGEYLVPPSEQAAQQLKLRGKERLVASTLQSGFWVKDGQTFIHIRELHPDASLRGVRLYAFDDDFHLVRVRAAARGQWTEAGHWQLFDVLDTRIETTGVRVESSPVQEWRSVINPDLLSTLMVNPERMSIERLRAYIQYLRENKQKANRYEIALWGKVLSPFVLPVMVFLALPFAYRPPREHGLGGRVLIGLLIGLSFYLLNRLSGHLGLMYDAPPLLSAALPLVVFTAAAMAALWWAERR